VIGYILLGIALAHLFWATVFVAWWLLLIRRSDVPTQQAIQDDFAAVRDSIRRATKARDRTMQCPVCETYLGWDTSNPEHVHEAPSCGHCGWPDA
jgi:hypothetical protein